MFEEMMKSMLAPVCWRRVKSDCMCIMLCTLIVYAGTAYATLAGASPEAGIAVSLAVGAMVHGDIPVLSTVQANRRSE